MNSINIDLLFLGENLADDGGLKAAFSAFTMLNVSRNEDRLMLPGFNLTQKQLFFLSFAQVIVNQSVVLRENDKALNYRRSAAHQVQTTIS